MKNRIFTIAAAMLTTFLAMTGEALAQSRFEANQPGFFGGYSTFGGYYDTFGDFGGRHTYNGYVRTDARNTPTTTLLTVPLQRRTHAKVKLKHVPVKVARGSDCGWLKHKARDTGQRKWKQRYETCRHVA